MYISLPLLTAFLNFLLSLYLLTLVSYQNSKLYLRRKCHTERRTTPKSNRMLCLSVLFFHSILVERNTFSIVLVLVFINFFATETTDISRVAALAKLQCDSVVTIVWFLERTYSEIKKIVNKIILLPTNTIK